MPPGSFLNRTDWGYSGVEEICQACPKHSECGWPHQYGPRLREVRVIFGTQAHLTRSPTFLLQLRHWTKAKRILVLLDELNVIFETFRRHLLCHDLTQFHHVLQHMNPQKWRTMHRQWVYLVGVLLQASTKDLRCPDWRFPLFFPDWALAVQARGWETVGTAFRFLAYDLHQFGRSLLDSRERTSTGDLLFATPPYVEGDCVIFSGSAHPDFTHFRFGQTFASPFADYQFEHPGTRWFNLASRLGTQRFFRNNARQILDFFAQLVAQRLKQGQRPILISKKCFVDLCARYLQQRFRALGFPTIHLVTNNFTPRRLSLPGAVPLIHYGLIGINTFEDFDCAFCLNSYYVNENVVNRIVQDVQASDRAIPIRIVTQGRPRRRRVEVVDPQHRVYDILHLAQLALDHQEMGAVLQAVGRVRPYTKPREILTFQCAEHPHLAYTQEFHSLGEARAFFGIETWARRIHTQTVDRIQRSKAGGRTQVQTAKALGISLSTVKRYWRTK